MWILIFLAMLLTSCHTSFFEPKEQVIKQEVNIDELEEVDLNLYELNPDFNIIMDSIIEKVINCPLYLNQQIGFEIIMQDSIQKAFTIFSTVNLNEQYYLAYDGISYYKGYQCGIIGTLNIYKKLNRRVRLYSISNEKFPLWTQTNIPQSHWSYMQQDNNQFECIEIKYCGNYIKHCQE